MQKLKLRLTIILIFTIISTLLPINSFAYDYSIREHSGYSYDFEGLSLYQEAFNNLVSVSEFVYSEAENAIISTYFEKILDLENEQELKKIDSLLKDFINDLKNIERSEFSGLNQNCSIKITDKISSLLDEFKSEMENQYSISWNWNESDKLFAIKQKLGIYAGLIIYSDRYDENITALLNRAIEKFVEKRHYWNSRGITGKKGMILM
ncbi:MAG: hypothetical protein GX213_05120 [Clostridiaceae bacterium]|nr:hypothetical protein [Clostridiaceae bacterium]